MKRLRPELSIKKPPHHHSMHAHKRMRTHLDKDQIHDTEGRCTKHRWMRVRGMSHGEK